MATNVGIEEAAPRQASSSTLQEKAKRHLWMHFTRMGSYADHEVPIIVRGDGCYVYDEHGKRYLDGLSALYCVNVGHGRAELAEAAARQAAELGFYTNWSYAHPPAIELAARIAELAPGGPEPRVLHLRRLRGGRVGLEARPGTTTTRNGEPQAHKIIARDLAYHGTSLGALTATGLPALREPFEPLDAGRLPRRRTRTPTAGPRTATRCGRPTRSRSAILFEGPETVAAVILEPVQNAGGCFVPQDGYFQRVREICDRHGVLLISDEVICSWGRLGHWFGCERYGYLPDIITTAKGITSALRADGRRDRLGRDRRAVPARRRRSSPTASRSAAHPVACAIGAGEPRHDRA